MSSILTSDVFFFVTTIAVVMIAVGVIVALVYIVRILRDVKTLSNKVKDEGQKILSDMNGYREDIKRQGFGLRDMLTWLGIINKPKIRVVKKKDEI
ncbi:MAG: hypothetical protein V4473_02080 [Patescibacteria group bacterium]